MNAYILKTYTLKVEINNPSESELNVEGMITNFERDIRAYCSRNRGSATLRLVAFEEQKQHEG